MYFYVKTDATPIIDKNEAEEYKWVNLKELKEIENKE